MRWPSVVTAGIVVSWWHCAWSRVRVQAFVSRQRRQPKSLSRSLRLFSWSPSREPSEDLQRKRPTAVDKPPVTETATPLPELDKLPVNHKILVVGATGRVGRLVVRQLLEQSPDGTLVVALVRDYDKACRVLYDDLVVMKQERRSPKLQIVAVELVPPSDIPHARAQQQQQHQADQEDDREWRQRAESAARFYGTQMSDYDDKENMVDDAARLQDEETTWRQVMEGCTAIVSCVGAVRATRPWSDWWLPRILQKDVRPWCADARHPYFTQFHATRKLLQMAEREQARRNVLWEAQDEEDRHKEGSSELLNRRRDKRAPPRRIRFVRLSDLAVTESAWALVPVFTNALRSMIFRYHEMADALVSQCRLLDTVIVRAGELVDDERDEDQVGVQVAVDQYQIGANTTIATTAGSVAWEGGEDGASSTSPTASGSHRWSPARVGRDDVAALLASAVLAPWLSSPPPSPTTENQTAAWVHYTLAVRWSGDEYAMSPYPSQGKKTHGCRTAAKSLRKAVRKAWSRRTVVPSTSTFSFRFKPYGVCVAIPLYLTLALVFRKIGKGLLLATSAAKIFARPMASSKSLPLF